jgi:lipid II:glycine glycyltransferase (peptidoglycan interpeptide bridge formation enzyme)
MTNKQKYRKFCQTEKDIPIFSKDWWLDAVCGEENWDVCLVEKGGQLVASMPYMIQKDSIFNVISMPHLTQTMGPYIKYPKGQKYEKRLSYEKQIMTKLINDLPNVDSFNQQFHYSITNWLPFYWKGFYQSTRYTYLLENTANLDLIWKNFTSETRTKINKATKLVHIEESTNIKEFFNMVKMTYKRQKLSPPYKYDLMLKIDNICKKNNNRKILFAIDTKGRYHASIYIIWDNKSVYLLASGGNPILRNSGAKNLLVWEAIKFAHINNLVFDFEGSMIESIEKYNRSFGAIQKPYFQIYKTNSKLWKIKSTIDRVVKR